MAATYATASGIFNIPCRLIENKYGTGNYDDATDDINAIILTIVADSHKLRSTVSINTTHNNPWFHTLDLAITGASSTELLAIEVSLRKKGLLNNTV